MNVIKYEDVIGFLDYVAHMEDQLKQIREIHIKRTYNGEDWCYECNEPFPCDTYEILDEPVPPNTQEAGSTGVS